MLGMLYENGPLLFKRNSTEMYINPFSWNLKANVMYLESPAGVGFSYGTAKGDLVANDTTTARENLLAMRMFFLKFPNLKKNDFYITGESYAGIYIPTLAKAIIDFNEEADVDRINLKGIAIGNGCTHPTECGNIIYSFYQYEAIVSWVGTRRAA
jgi:serine carboxypeptidase-like clade 2